MRTTRPAATRAVADRHTVMQPVPLGGPQPVPLCQLQAVPRTLLVTLAARAWGGEHFPALDCHDAQARRLLSCMDPARSLAPVAGYVVRNVLWRTRVFLEQARAFFEAHPQATGVNVGCGLADPYQWLDNGRNRWVDADLAPVIALRRRLLPPRTPRQRTVALDLRQPGWWTRLGLDDSGDPAPVLLMCEGVLMYLRPSTVQAVLQECAREAPAGSRLMADFISYLGVGWAHAVPGLAQTGAQFRWGAARLAEFTAAHPRLQLLEQRSAAELDGWPLRVGEALWQPLLGPALYGVVVLGVRGEAWPRPRLACAAPDSAQPSASRAGRPTSAPRRGC